MGQFEIRGMMIKVIRQFRRRVRYEIKRGSQRRLVRYLGRTTIRGEEVICLAIMWSLYSYTCSDQINYSKTVLA